jgi:hypothetical protein
MSTDARRVRRPQRRLVSRERLESKNGWRILKARRWIAVRQHERDPLAFEVRSKGLTDPDGYLMSRCRCVVATTVFAQTWGRNETLGAIVCGA